MCTEKVLNQPDDFNRRHKNAHKNRTTSSNKQIIIIGIVYWHTEAANQHNRRSKIQAGTANDYALRVRRGKSNACTKNKHFLLQCVPFIQVKISDGATPSFDSMLGVRSLSRRNSIGNCIRCPATNRSILRMQIRSNPTIPYPESARGARWRRRRRSRRAAASTDTPIAPRMSAPSRWERT